MLWATFFFFVLRPIWPYYYKLIAAFTQFTLTSLGYTVTVSAGKKWGMFAGKSHYIYFLSGLTPAQLDASFASLNLIPFLALMFASINRPLKTFCWQLLAGIFLLMLGHLLFFLSAFFYFCQHSFLANIFTTFFGNFGNILLPFLLWLLFRQSHLKEQK